MTQKCNLRLDYFHFKRSFEKRRYVEDAKPPPESLQTVISELTTSILFVQDPPQDGSLATKIVKTK